jgi:hypothetical protein
MMRGNREENKKDKKGKNRDELNRIEESKPSTEVAPRSHMQE